MVGLDGSVKNVMKWIRVIWEEKARKVEQVFSGAFLQKQKRHTRMWKLWKYLTFKLYSMKIVKNITEKNK